MDISELIATEPATETAAPAAPGDLGRQEFLSMLIAQLENQDPLNPQDATQFTAQLAQFSSLEQLMGMRASIDALATTQASAQNLGTAVLIGREGLVSTDRFTIDTDPESARPGIVLDALAPTEVLDVEIRNSLGSVVGRTGPLGTIEAGRLELPADAFGAELPPGNYTASVVTNPGVLPPSLAVRARISGASLEGGESRLFLGEVEVPLASLLEVRE